MAGKQGRSHMHFTWCTGTRVQMENLKLLSETLLDNYRITIDMKKECTRVFLDLASPLNGVIFIHTCQGLTMKNTIILCYVADLGLEKPITSVA